MNNKYKNPDKRINDEKWKIFMDLVSTEIEYCMCRQAFERKGIDMDKALHDHDMVMGITICRCLGFKDIRGEKEQTQSNKKYRLNNRTWKFENIIAITLTILEDYVDRIHYRFDNRQDGVYECAMVLYKRFLDNVYIYRTPDLYKLTHQQDEK